MESGHARVAEVAIFERTAEEKQARREALHRLHEHGITEEERQAAIGFLQGRRPFGRQSPRQILDTYLWERRHGYPRDFRDRMVEKAASLPLDEINAFIRAYYDPAGFTMIKVVPE